MFLFLKSFRKAFNELQVNTYHMSKRAILGQEEELSASNTVKALDFFAVYIGCYPITNKKTQSQHSSLLHLQGI